MFHRFSTITQGSSCCFAYNVLFCPKSSVLWVLFYYVNLISVFHFSDFHFDILPSCPLPVFPLLWKLLCHFCSLSYHYVEKLHALHLWLPIVYLLLFFCDLSSTLTHHGTLQVTTSCLKVTRASNLCDLRLMESCLRFVRIQRRDSVLWFES